MADGAGLNSMAWPLLSAAASAFTALLFLRAAWHKMSDFPAFTGFLADYDIVPDAQVAMYAMALVILETGVVAGLLIPGIAFVASLSASILLLGYAAAIAVNIARGRDRVECGCGGAPQPLNRGLVWRNILLAGWAALPLFIPAAGLPITEKLAALSSAILLWALYLLLDQLLSTSAHMRLRS